MKLRSILAVVMSLSLSVSVAAVLTGCDRDDDAPPSTTGEGEGEGGVEGEGEGGAEGEGEGGAEGEGEGGVEGEGEGGSEGEGEGGMEGEGEGGTEGEGEGGTEGEGEGGGGPCDADIVINEVLYDPEGNEGQGKSFVELRGPAGTALDAWAVAKVRSNGLLDGVPLVLEGSIPADGYFVVGESTSVQGDVRPDQVSDAIDGINTASAFRLTCRGDVVDAVSYGQWEADEFGEGRAAPGVEEEGLSLSRCPDGVDTGNNFFDFRSSPATPGAVNDQCPPPDAGCDPGAPNASPGDVLINEVATEPVQVGPRNAPEFIEIVNVTAGEIDLSGHRVAWNPQGGVFNSDMPLPDGTCLRSDDVLLIWGGDNPPLVRDGRVVTRGALNIRNDEGEVHLLSPAGNTLDVLCYGSDGCPLPSDTVSLTRDPDLTDGGEVVGHDVAWSSNGSKASPGTCQDGTDFPSGCPSPAVLGCDDAVPEGPVINEIGFDPVVDHNGDGAVNQRDEFIEVLNHGNGSADLGGWSVADETGIRFTIPEGTSLAAGKALVLLATPAAECPGSLGEGVEHLCAGVLGLNDAGDLVSLSPPGGGAGDTIAYGEADPPCVNPSIGGQSFTRNPDGGARLVPHRRAYRDLPSSPGLRVDGTAF